MKRFISLVCVLCALALLPLGALADQQYFLESDSRKITEAELWQWDRESLAFMFNEIFARHGFTFQPGGKFYNWFNSLPWYQATPKVSDQEAYNRTSALEWENYHTIKKVLAEMEAAEHPYRRPAGSNLKSWTDLAAPGSWSLTGFQYVNMKSGQDLAVYSGCDDQTVPVLSLGGAGVISVASNVLPREMSGMCRLWFGGETEKAAEMQLKLLEIMNQLMIETNPIPAKAACAAMGFGENRLRLPLVPMEEHHEQKLLELMKAAGALR